MQILRNLRRSFFFFFPFTFSPLFALLWEGRESVKLNSGNNHRGLPRKGKFVNFLHRCICLAPPWMGKLRIEGETLFLVKSRYTRDLFRQIFRPSFICSNITFNIFRTKKKKSFYPATNTFVSYKNIIHDKLRLYVLYPLESLQRFWDL